MELDASRIRLERQHHGWSQEHLAEVAGLSARTVQRLELTGRASGESAQAIATALGITVRELCLPPPGRAVTGSRRFRFIRGIAIGCGAVAAAAIGAALFFRPGIEASVEGEGVRPTQYSGGFHEVLELPVHANGLASTRVKVLAAKVIGGQVRIDLALLECTPAQCRESPPVGLQTRYGEPAIAAWSNSGQPFSVVVQPFRSRLSRWFRSTVGKLS